MFAQDGQEDLSAGRRLLTTISQLGKEWKFSLEFQPQTLTTGCAEFLHFKRGGNDFAPSFYTTCPNSNKWRVHFTGSHAIGHVVDLPNTAVVGSWNQYEYTQKKIGSRYYTIISVNGLEQYREETSGVPAAEFQNVELFVGSGAAGLGAIRSIVVQNL